MEWTADNVRKIQQLDRELSTVSLNDVIKNTGSDSNDESEVGEFIDSGIRIEEDVIRKDGAKQFLKYLDKLEPREQLILRLRYGIDDGVPKTLQEVGTAFGVTRERARQIEEKALRKLRTIVKQKNLTMDDFI